MKFMLSNKWVDIDFKHAYCIGYSGRNVDKTKAHIAELKKLGVPEPASIPEIYHLSSSLFKQVDSIDVVGNKTSGEAEIVLLFSGEQCYVTLGSDHTDRDLETVSIHKSKQVCAKPLATDLWCFEDVQEQWDNLQLSSYIMEDGEWKLYQQDAVSSILPVENLMKTLTKEGEELTNTIVYCGTVPLIDGFKYPKKFKAELFNPEKNNTIELTYSVNEL